MRPVMQVWYDSHKAWYVRVGSDPTMGVPRCGMTGREDFDKWSSLEDSDPADLSPDKKLHDPHMSGRLVQGLRAF